MATDFTPGRVETISKTRADGTAYTLYRVRWLNPEDGCRYPYSGLASVPDGELFRAWLTLKGGRVTAGHLALIDGTWRGGDVTETAGTISRDAVTFGDFARRNIAERDIAGRTRDQLSGVLKNYFAELDTIQMRNIDQKTVCAALARLDVPRILPRGKGKASERTLSAVSRCHYSWFLWGICTAAVDAGILKDHPFRKSVPGTVDVKLERPTNVRRIKDRASFNLSVENYTALLTAASEIDRVSALIIELMLKTGLRIGEALALQLRHVDWNSGIIHVEQALTRDEKGTSRVGRPKKATDDDRSESERPVHLPDDIGGSLLAYLADEGVSVSDGNRFLFPAPRAVRGSRPWGYSVWAARRFTPIRALAQSAYGLTANPTPHSLRHTFACRMLTAGMPIYDVSKMLGHESVQTTEQIYADYCDGDLHARARLAAAAAFPATAENAAGTVLRNGWYVDGNGERKRRQGV
jgi:integrase